jgi:PAS domain S-box-containing protein
MTGFWGIAVLLGSVSLMATVFYFRQEIVRRQRAETVLRQQTNRERLVTQIAQHIRQSLDAEAVLATTVQEVQQFLQADRVLIYRLWPDGTGSAVNETVIPPFPAILGMSFPPEVFPPEYHAAYSLGKTKTIADVDQGIEACLADFVKQFGVRAKLVVPIIQENSPESVRTSKPHLWGLLIAHQCQSTRSWQPWEVELMQQLATQVAIAIHQSELHNQLQQLNTDLESRVQQRTQELAQANVALRAEIVERQRTEAALRQTNYTLQALINASPRAIFTLDVAGKVNVWNPAAELLFGWTEAEVLNQSSPVPIDEPLEDGSTLYANVLNGTIYTGVEQRQHRKDGTEIDVIVSMAPLQDSEGRTNGIVAVIADITERKRLDEIRLALERERELSALKTRFFSMASHEFRTPLSTALAAAQVLENSSDVWQDSEKRRRNLRRIQDAVNNMVQMLNDILTINRAETGKLDFKPKRLDLDTFCQHLIEEMRLSVGSLHQLVFTQRGTAVTVYLDEKLLTSMLSNLLWNAVKYSPQGGEVSLTLEFQPEQILLEIGDQGIGIPPEDLDQLFEPFHRGRNVRTIPGTGLGLVVVQKCVELHHGTLAITSELGVGTTCRITLPLS